MKDLFQMLSIKDVTLPVFFEKGMMKLNVFTIKKTVAEYDDSFRLVQGHFYRFVIKEFHRFVGLST